MMFSQSNEYSYERKVALIERAMCDMDITLDGSPAILMGSKMRFASVARKDGRGGVVEFAWATVENILNKGGAFKS